MTEDFSSDGLLSYLREETVAGRMHPATARSRRKAAEELFPYLDDAEREDLRRLDLGNLAARVEESPRGDLRAELVDLYAQRLSGALEAYLGSYGATPGSGSAAPVRAAAPRTDETALQPEEERALESVRLSFDRYKADVIPVPLGHGRVVYIHGMPADLTTAEAHKIARVVQAFAGGDEEDG